MKAGWSERVREVADREFVRPARGRQSVVKIRFGDLSQKMMDLGMPQRNINQVGSAIETAKFWEALGLEMCTPKGLPRKVGSVFEFRFVGVDERKPDVGPDPLLGLVGILDGAICEGADTFIRNIRVDKGVTI